MGVAKSLCLGLWTCSAERSGLMSGCGEKEGIDVWSSASMSLPCEGLLVGVTGLMW
jgi:hypothetical protein